MNEILKVHPVSSPEFLLGFGIGLVILYFILLLSFSIWDRVWAWIDDGKPPKVNALNKFIQGLFGWEPNEKSVVRWKSKELTECGSPKYISDDQGHVHVIIGIVLFITPIVTYWAWFVPLTIGIMVVMAHMARGMRRGQKAFQQHIEDKEAHK